VTLLELSFLAIEKLISARAPDTERCEKLKSACAPDTERYERVQ